MDYYYAIFGRDIVTKCKQIVIARFEVKPGDIVETESGDLAKAEAVMLTREGSEEEKFIGMAIDYPVKNAAGIYSRVWKWATAEEN